MLFSKLIMIFSKLIMLYFDRNFCFKVKKILKKKLEN